MFKTWQLAWHLAAREHRINELQSEHDELEKEHDELQAKYVELQGNWGKQQPSRDFLGMTIRNPTGTATTKGHKAKGGAAQ